MNQREEFVARLFVVRNAPSMALVTAPECCFSTPRIIMQKCRASQMTPTPSGSIIPGGLRDLLRQPLLDLQPAREHVHQARHLAQPDHPVLAGCRPRALLPKNGSMWCSHMLKNSMSFTITISSYFTA